MIDAIDTARWIDAGPTHLMQMISMPDSECGEKYLRNRTMPVRMAQAWSNNGEIARKIAVETAMRSGKAII